MPTLDELRQQRPDELRGLDDEHAIEYLRRVYRPQTSRDDLARELGVVLPPTPGRSRTWGEALGDTGRAVMAGGAGVVEGAGTLYGLATGDMDNTARDLGQGAREYWQAGYSDPLKKKLADRSAAIAAQEGILGQFGTALGRTITDPALLGETVASNALLLVPGMAAGRGAAAAAAARGLPPAAAGTIGTGTAIGVGAAQHGADVAGAAYDTAVERGGEHDDALEAARSTFPAAAALSIGANALPGAGLLERALVGGAARQTIRASGGGLLGAIAKGAVGSAAEETIEEGGGRALGNAAVREYVDQTMPIAEGVGEAAGLGAAGGLALGAFGGSMQRRAHAEAAVDSSVDATQPAAARPTMPIERPERPEQPEEDYQPLGPFFSEGEAADYISRHRRISPHVPRALPRELEDGSWDIVLAGTPEYDAIAAAAQQQPAEAAAPDGAEPAAPESNDATRTAEPLAASPAPAELAPGFAPTVDADAALTRIHRQGATDEALLHEPDTQPALPQRDPGDILNRSGRPFQSLVAARNALAKQAHPHDRLAIVQVADGWVLRPRATSTGAPGATAAGALSNIKQTTPAEAQAPAPAAAEASALSLAAAEDNAPPAGNLAAPSAGEPQGAIDAAANEAATSPTNDLPEPTEAQKQAGNYKVGRARWNGLDLSFENPKGSERKGVDPHGSPWSVTMPAHYGYVRRTEGADGDHVDVYMGDAPESDQVFVVDQVDAGTGKFDEHKVVLGTNSIDEATALYDAGFSDGKGPQRRGAVTAPEAPASASIAEQTAAASGVVPQTAEVGGASTEVAAPVGSRTTGPTPSPSIPADGADAASPAEDSALAPNVNQQGAAGEKDQALPAEATAPVADAPTKPATTPAEYFYTDREGVRRPLAAKFEPREVPGLLDGMQFIVHRRVGSGPDHKPSSHYSVTEISSGAELVFGDTADAAIDRARMVIATRGADEVRRRVEAFKERHRVAAASAAPTIPKRIAKAKAARAAKAATQPVVAQQTDQPSDKQGSDQPVSDEAAGASDVEAPAAPASAPSTAKSEEAAPGASANTIFTEEAAAKARALLKRKLGQLSSGLDPELIQAGITLAGYHIERGARKFSAYAQAMIADLGEVVRPYLKSWYAAVSFDPRAQSLVVDMTPIAELASIPDTAQQEERREPAEPTASADRPAGTGDVPGVDRGTSTAGGRDGAADVDPRHGTGAGVLEAAPPADVQAPGHAARAPVRRRARSSNVAAGGRDDQGGGEPAGRAGTSGAGLAADGAGSGPEPVASRAVERARRPNYRITDPRALIGGGPKARFARNRKALETLETLQAEQREPTQEELDALAAYIGWGSFGQALFQGTYDAPRPQAGWEDEARWLRDRLGREAWEAAQVSIINAHFTDPPVVTAMWDMVRRAGFRGGRVLEPSMGTGNFFGLMPADLMNASTLTGIELDPTTGAIAQILYPQANIQIKGYQDSKTADGFYDLAIGNWPFGSTGPADRRYNKLSPSLHDYFFLKALDQVRAGGLVVGITSSFSMDKQGVAARRAMAGKADLVAAFRLPTGAFDDYAGTAVVTDIIVLRKREQPNADPRAAGWINAVKHATPTGDVQINEYYAANTQNVLGTMRLGSHTTYSRAGLEVVRPDDLPQRLAAAVERLPEGVYAERQTGGPTINYVANDTAERQNSVVAGADGGLFVVQGDVQAPLHEILRYRVKDPARTLNRETQIRGLIGLRRGYDALMRAERTGAADTETLRADLRAAYEAFTAAHGSVNLSDGLAILRRANDPHAPTLAALETRTGDQWGPARVLREPTTRSRKRLDKPTVREAYVVARNESRTLNMARVAELAAVSQERAVRELTDSGAVFKLPDGSYEPADVYMSGNVRRKLREAEDAQAQGLAMDANIKALRGVLPTDIPYYDIEAKLGAAWISEGHYREFIGHLLATDVSASDVDVRFSAGTWRVRFAANELRSRPEAQVTWGTGRIRFDRLLTAAMGNQAIRIYARDDDGKPVLDEKASEQANNKAAAIREEFSEWSWRDPVRRMQLERTYNDVMNAVATSRYDGSFLSFEGMALRRGEDALSLRTHQADHIWMALVNGKSMGYHEVGTGKTITIAGIAVESRRYGLARKSIVFAHNANSATVAREIVELYPAAKVLYIDNLSPETIQTKLRQIANDEWDAVVVPHSLIDRFTLSADSIKRLTQPTIDQLLDDAAAAAAEDGQSFDEAMLDNERALKNLRSATAKQIVKQIQAIKAKVEKDVQRATAADAVVFDDLGIDQIIVDEIHEFKKPPITTRMTVRGLNRDTSAMSVALRYLTDFVKEQNGGRGVHGFTGTPITNTLAELYHQMRYVMSHEMARDGIDEWDAWFNTFADAETDVELSAAGTYEPVTRLAAFVNTAELRRIAGEFMSVVFADDMPEFKPRATVSGKTMASPGLTEAERDELENGRNESAIGRPYKKVVTDTGRMAPQQRQILERLQDRARDWAAATKKQRVEWMLAGDPRSPVIQETNAANAGLDARLYDMEAADDPDNKVNRTARNVLRHYREHDLATQVVFVERGYSDTREVTAGRNADGKRIMAKKPGFNLVADLVDKLVTGGIPRERIAVVNGAVSKERRKAIADAMNTGEIRVVIGLTKTLGVGVNMQRNLRAMHHMDAPWMPGELEQRNGRGHRQGNAWNTVFEYRYVTEKLDGRRWQVLLIKQKFITRFLKADESTRVIDGDAVDAQDEGASDLIATLSEAAGDPRVLLLEKWRTKVRKLERRERTHSQGIADAVRAAQRARESALGLRAVAERMRPASDHYATLAGQPFAITIGGKRYDKRTEADDAIVERTKSIQPGSQWVTIGAFHGFEIVARWPHAGATLQFEARHDGGHQQAFGGSVASLEARLRGLAGQIGTAHSDALNSEAQADRLEQTQQEPFSQQAALDRARQMVRDIETDLDANPESPPEWLRNGAPIGTDVVFEGKTHSVAGHKWDATGYALVLEGADGATVRAPYMDVRDEQGLPVYEERAFEAPRRAAPPAQAHGAMPAPEAADAEGPPQVHSDLSNRQKAVAAAVDRALAREPGQPAALPRVVVRGRLDKLLRRFRDGDLDAQQLAEGVDALATDLQARAVERSLTTKPRERGADYVRERLLQAKRRGDISEEAADFAEWFILKNEALLDDLGISVRSAANDRTSGNYDPARRLVTLFKGQANDGSAVHEILHHLERMMPPEMQADVQQAWFRALAAALDRAKKAGDMPVQEYVSALLDFYLNGNRASIAKATKMLKEGAVGHEHYHLLNPSEFWAVNMTRTAQARFEARGDLWARTKQWLREALEHIRGALGLRSQAPLLRALDALLEHDGKMRSDRMLAPDSAVYEDIPDRPITAQSLLDSKVATRSDRVRGAVDKSRPFFLGALTREQIADIYRDVPQVAEYDELARRMEAQRQKMAQAADEIYQRWAKLDKETNERLTALMADATVHQVHPDRPFRVIAGADNGLRKRTHTRLAREWAELPDEARAVYAEVSEHYTGTLENLQRAIAARIGRSAATGKNKQEQLLAIRATFDRHLQHGPYFPLARFGDYLVIAQRQDDGDRVVASYENAGEQQAAARRLLADGYAVKMKVARAYSREVDGDASKFIGDVLATLDSIDFQDAQLNGRGVELKAQMLDDINQMAIRALPGLSYRKHFAHRKGTPGFSADMMRAFASSAFHSAAHIARLNHADQMTFTLVDAEAQVSRETEGDFNTRSQVLNELIRRHETTLNPKTHPLAALLNQVGFTMYLAASPAAGLVNLLQTPMVTLPWLGARYGFGGAGGALTKALADVMAAPWQSDGGKDAAKSPKLTPEEARMIRALADEGVIDLTQSLDLAAATSLDTGNVARSRTAFAFSRAMRIIGWTFHVPEVLNRQSAALAAYRLEMAKSGSEDRARDAAREAIKWTHFNYGASNRPRYMQGDVMRVITQFKAYAQQMTYFLARALQQGLRGETPEVRAIARRQFVASLAAVFAMAGTLGLPGLGAAMGLVEFAVGLISDEDDEPWDWQSEFRALAADAVGKDVGEVLSHGLPRAILPFDMASRVGLADLWVRENGRAGDNPREAYAAMMSTLLGPTIGGTLSGLYVAADHMAAGRWAKATEGMVPKAVRDLIRAGRYADEGVTSYDGKPLLDVGAAEVAAQAIGFAPRRAAEMYEGKRAIKDRETWLKERHDLLLELMARARLEGDLETIDDLQARIERWNEAQPDFAISGQAIRRSIRARVRQEQNTEDGVYLPRSREALRESGAFANVD